MRKLFLLRHSLTEGNERHLYSGRVDIPLTDNGRRIAGETRINRPMLPCDLYLTSGMLRANETLRILTGKEPDAILGELREMDFGSFELKGYEQLKGLPEYQAWIGDESETTTCPGGESIRQFRDRVARGAERLMSMEWCTACVVCHGGTIVRLMEAWFPQTSLNYYQWQPGACGGYLVRFEEKRPIDYMKL